MKTIGIVGSGSWALALSKVIKNGSLIVKTRDLKKASKSFKKVKNLELTDRFEDLSNCKYIFLAIPSQALRQIIKSIKKTINLKNCIFIICSKGVEKKTNQLMSQVFKEILNNRFVILSGPNFSDEVIKGLPTATVISCENSKTAKEISLLFTQEKFRTYFNTDIIGTQIGGAMKNVIAIACGLIQGNNLGFNAQASIVTRGLSEIVELGIILGAKKNTFFGLSGIGDLTLTCSSLKSRNTKLGFDIGRKLTFSRKSNKQILTEGFESCESICMLGKRFKVELPICNAVQKILNGSNVNKVIKDLLARPLQFEK